MNDIQIITRVRDDRLCPTDAQKNVVKAFLSQRDGKEVVVTFSSLRKVRSGNQNRFYWGICMSMIALETGHSPEEIHEWCKDAFLPRSYVTIAGVEREIAKSTTDLTTTEFEAYLDRIRAFAAQELRMNIPLPNEG